MRWRLTELLSTITGSLLRCCKAERNKIEVRQKAAKRLCTDLVLQLSRDIIQLSLWKLIVDTHAFKGMHDNQVTMAATNDHHSQLRMDERELGADFKKSFDNAELSIVVTGQELPVPLCAKLPKPIEPSLCSTYSEL